MSTGGMLRQRPTGVLPGVHTRTRFEHELQDLGLTTGVRSEIGGYWVSLDQRAIVRIILIDPSGVFRNRKALRERITAKLRAKFSGLDPQIEDWYAFVTEVEYRDGEPSKEAKKAFGKLDFPVYLLASQHSERSVKKLMEEHGIPTVVFGKDVYKLAEDGWRAKDVRGIGIPSGKGYRKVGFIKTYKVFDDAGSDVWLAFVNVIGHEIGHMGNRSVHSKSGLMKYPVRLDVELDFSTEDKAAFVGNLVRLAVMK